MDQTLQGRVREEVKALRSEPSPSFGRRFPPAINVDSSGIDLVNQVGSGSNSVAAPQPLEPLRLVPALCALCGVEDVEPIAVGADFEYRTSSDEFLAVRCRRCKLVYLNPRPADSEAARIYPDSYHAFQFRPAEYGLVYRVRRRLEARRLLYWCRGLPEDGRILDIGCGDGLHLGLLREFGRQLS